jgi:regulator of cell morphogenesis and NO signaling
MTFNQDQTTREVAIQHPETVPVFESLGIDYCCGGTRTLGEACQRANVDWTELVERLQAVDTPSMRGEIDWTAQPLDELSRHIIDTHHAYIERNTPGIHRWLEKVVTKHGAAHRELAEIRRLFTALSNELAAHMMKEERILFPHFNRLAAAARQRPAAGMFLGSAELPIRQMCAEHDDAGELLAKIRKLSGGYQPPEDACPTYRALYHGLAEFERDLHRHVHLENNILFPRALALENQHLSVE